ncbi:MAG: hypothetical protein ACTSU9_04975 [Promethearchaeota archaeon]
MNPLFEDIPRTFFSPGNVGRSLRCENKRLSTGEILARIALHLMFPSFMISWILLYSLTGGSNFTMFLTFNVPISIFEHPISLSLLLLFIVGLVISIFWLFPAGLSFFINIAFPKNRKKPMGKLSGNYFVASMSSFNIYYPFILVSLVLMTSKATFFQGMRTMEDIVFTVSLATSLIVELISLSIITKNYFSKGFWPMMVSFPLIIGGIISPIVILLL